MDESEAFGVLLGSPHPLVRAGLRAMLERVPELCPIGEAATGDEVRQLCRAARPAVVVIDVELVGPSAPDTAAALRRDCPATRIVALAPSGAVDAVRILVALGAVGAVALDEEADAITQAICAVARGGTRFAQATLAALVQGPLRRGATVLTPREREVLALLAAGRRNTEIADALAVSLRTVEFHVGNLLGKLGARSRLEALRYARERGLLDGPGTPAAA